MIVSPRRLILAITLAPPVIKIKQQGGSVQFLTFMSQYTLYVDKKIMPFIYGWLYPHVVYMRIIVYPHIHYMRIKKNA